MELLEERIRQQADESVDPFRRELQQAREAMHAWVDSGSDRPWWASGPSREIAFVISRLV
eukprot:6477789-Amphidinium_carterae.1